MSECACTCVYLRENERQKNGCRLTLRVVWVGDGGKKNREGACGNEDLNKFSYAFKRTLKKEVD